MKKKLFFSFSIFLLLGISQLVYSQEYLQMIEAGTYSVEEIVNNAETYFADKDKGRGSGYIPFKRWEYMANRLKNEEGYLTPFTERLVELERYNAFLNETASERQNLFDNWQELGPDYWNATTHWSPGVGRITGIAVDATNNNHIIVGANTGGVWRTVDGGATWAPLGDYFSNLYVYSVAIDPNDSDTYFFGSGSGLIYKSTDAGSTWNLLGNAGASLINKILLNPTDSNIMFATSQNNGIYGSTDGGSTWTKLINSENRAYDVEFRPGDTNTVYASGNGFWLSSDGGVNFTQIGGFDSGPKMIGVSANNPDIVYVVEADSGQFGGFYQSTNSGASFTELDHTGRNYFGYDTAGFDPGGQAPRDMDITVNPNDENEVHIAGVLTWRSTDGGATFSCTADWIPNAAANANIGYCHADVDILEFIGSTLYVGTDGGIYKATNTGTVNANYYEDLTTGIGIRQFYKIGVSQTPQVRVTGGSQDNGSSFYDANTGNWIDWVGADGMEGFVSKDNIDFMFAMIQFGAMYRTTTGGINLTTLSNPGSGSGNWVSPFEQDPIIPGTIYCGYNIIYKNPSNGNNGAWVPISQDFGGNLDNLKIAPSNSLVMYASRGAFLYRTTDGGLTNWSQMTQPGGFINSIAVHPSNPDKIAIATSSATKVRISDDGGATWQDYLFNLPNFSSLAVVWDDNGDDGLYVGMDYGVYYIDNTFADWQPFITNLPNVIINELEINQADGKIYAGTYGRGLWASPKYGVVLSTNEVLSSELVTLYPNPANSQIKILYQGEAEMDIRVFDTTGKLVIFEPDVIFKGQHSLNVSHLNSGVYFVRMNSGKGVVTKRFIKN